MSCNFASKLSQLVAIINVEPGLFLYIVSAFIHLPVFQALLLEKSCLHANGFNCSNFTDIRQSQTYQTEANLLFLLSTLCLTVPSIFSCVLIGLISDSRSRKLAVALPYVGILLCDINSIIQTTYVEFSPYYLLVGDLTFGIFGGFTGVFVATFSYAAASTSVEMRSTKMAMMESTLGFGGTVGFLVSGSFLQRTDYKTVYYVVASMHLAALLLTVFQLQNIPDNQPTAHNSKKSPWHSLKQFVQILLKKRPNNMRKYLTMALASFALSYFVAAGSQSILYFFIKSQEHLNWSTSLYGYYKGITYGMCSVMVLLLYPLLRSKFQDLSLALVGLVCRMVTCAMMTMSFSTWFVFATALPYMFTRFGATGLRSFVSKNVEHDEQGKFFAAMSVMEGICSLCASALFNSLFPKTLGHFSALSFLLMTLIMLIPIILISYTAFKTSRNKTMNIDNKENPTTEVLLKHAS